MKAFLISIGNELLNGRTVNGNAAFIGQHLFDIGIPVEEVLTIRDEAEMIGAALSEALRLAEIVIITGGLGPTHDDITKKTLAAYFDARLQLDEDVLKQVKERFRKRGMHMPEINREQALVPDKARPIVNPAGTAPGLHFQQDEKHVFATPGVPREMQLMMETDILPFLRKQFPTRRRTVTVYRTTGIAESKIYEKCRDLIEAHPDYEIASLPRYTGVDLRISLPENSTDPHAALAEFREALRKRIGKYIYTEGDKELEEVVGEELRRRGLCIAVAESCTGGLVQHQLTRIAGSSDYFPGGAVTYSNASKIDLLGVSSGTLESAGAVSAEVAGEMAAGVRRRLGTDIGISTTGIAGPAGATADKPVGLVYIGLADGETTAARRFLFGEDRHRNQERSAVAALELLRRHLLGIETGLR